MSAFTHLCSLFYVDVMLRDAAMMRGLADYKCRGLEMFMLRCACRHVADGSAPGDSNIGEKNLVLDTLVQRSIEVRLNDRERAEYTRVQAQAVQLHTFVQSENVNLIEALRRPLSGVDRAAGALRQPSHIPTTNDCQCTAAALASSSHSLVEVLCRRYSAAAPRKLAGWARSATPSFPIRLQAPSGGQESPQAPRARPRRQVSGVLPVREVPQGAGCAARGAELPDAHYRRFHLR